MKELEIDKIEILELYKLRITPLVKLDNHYELIYRSATGIRWDKELNCFYYHESFYAPSWSALDFYKNMMSTLADVSVNLKITKNTEWINVSQSIQQEFLEYDASLEI